MDRSCSFFFTVTGMTKKFQLRNLLTFLAALTICHVTYAAELFGTVEAVTGSAFVSDQSGKSVDISASQKIYEGQTINTGSDGEVHIVTEDGGMIALRPDTLFRVDEYKAEGGSSDRIFMSLFKGAVRSITGWIGKHNSSAYLITTPTATIGIRGTDHETTVIDKADGDELGTYDTVNEGATLLKTPHGSTEVTPGKHAFAPKTRAVTPFLLAQQPNFWAKRRLKIEERIQIRKEYLRDRMEESRNKRITRLETIRKEREQARKQNQVLKKRNEVSNIRLEQARQRREELHTKAQQRRHKQEEQREKMKKKASENQEEHRKPKK